jgi:hypothetical protein
MGLQNIGADEFPQEVGRKPIYLVSAFLGCICYMLTGVCVPQP